ncbi:Glycosyl transferase [Macleaya cordata]|uniref:Alpha-1,3-glucosyltransferase n=1 Tax=Macleaya cordata TaxID=56857 RepID=A0A200QQG9_MACCD|nr:Glycosyl transferase [Macleaya cordata]
MEELAWFAGIATCVKLLLIPSYRSTDFEVHRNWLALTSSLSLSNWYSDETSQWTLDYPPLFAYFEKFLSIFARLVDPKIVNLHQGLNYSADSHLFAVAAPVYFVYLLRHYCRGGFVRSIGRFVMMGMAVGVVFAVAFGPFLYYGQIQQVIHRMFPFGRGLCHAYWAPNFWVFYIILDKGLAFLLAKLGFNIQAPAASFTGGLVGDSSPFAVLPRVTPLATFMLVIVAISPCLFKAWRNPRSGMITRWVAYAYTCGFLFGWHVHEKASLHFVIPLAIVAIQRLEDAKLYFVLSIVSCYSMFPLLFEAKEYPIKVLLLLLHSLLMWSGFTSQFNKNSSSKTKAEPVQRGKSDAKMAKGRKTDEDGGVFVVGWFGTSYLLGLLGIEIWGQFLQPYLLGGEKLPFLPLMLVSIYCGLGMVYSWFWQLRWIIKCS